MGGYERMHRMFLRLRTVEFAVSQRFYKDLPAAVSGQGGASL